MHPREFYRHCPRCGSSAFVAGADNGIACNDCGFHWYYNSAAAVDVIITNKLGHILITQRARDPHKGMLDLPGGFVDAGETMEDAARREIREELGIELGSLHYLSSFPSEYAFGGVIYFAVDAIFLASFEEQELFAGDDVSQFSFIAPDALDLTKIGLGSTRAALAYYCDRNVLPHQS